MNQRLKYGKLDWPLIFISFTLMMIGWISVFASVYDEDHARIFDLSQRYGMQFVWIVTSLVIAYLILFVINPKSYHVIAWLLYAGTILMLIAVIFMGVEVNGSKSWFMVGPFRLQPAEFSKITSALALAALLSKHNFKLGSLSSYIKVGALLLAPMMLIIMEKETGSALVYLAFFFVLFREGMSGMILAIGLLAILLFILTLTFSPFIGLLVLVVILSIVETINSKKVITNVMFMAVFFPALYFSPKLAELPMLSRFANVPAETWMFILIIPLIVYQLFRAIKKKIAYLWYLLMCFAGSVALIYSVEFIFNNVLQEHQRVRIENLLGIENDLQGWGYNVHQSKIAIGSGGFMGKGFLQGTQTKFDFVPEQSTDFIFCTIGEEWGFVGSLFVIVLFVYMIIRILNLADKQRDSFARIYGYSVASILFFHFFINIGMTIGLTPVIGIPLPFISYGGSSLWAFTILLFIFIRLELERWN
jgi:rod shape determining protein RodA